ncbi:hypothetical protein [Hymenobacter amundsenii]|uniref:hypothetical protein n=1 Tax=Hymenobacter amundsenii TaxID=2006685 RepID=UPI000F817960|nr:hypothetical protein [Hymenobacter amundsenii]
MKKVFRLIPAVIFASLSSCEILDEGGTGTYMVGISNSTNTNYHIQIHIDGVKRGDAFPKANQLSSFAGDCNDISYSMSKDYIGIVYDVETGNHKVELIDATNNRVMSRASFTMVSDGCVTQLAEF